MYKSRGSILLLILLFVAFSTASANAFFEEDSVAICEQKFQFRDSVLTSITTDTLVLQLNLKDVAPLSVFPSNDLKQKKRVCAFFAFPFPFGFVGAHRVMLGTKPWIPIIYIATFGGCFGLLPLIDFLVILNAKDMEQYENNPNLFMWIK
ncbi:MAG: NINE protein [Bacteroidetes bacterium]|nr:NINE protein [Bacteroidota bacterium]